MLFARELLRAADVVDVVRVAAVDQDVARLRGAAAGRRWSRRRRPPAPSARSARGLCELLHEVRRATTAPTRLLLDQRLHRLRRHVEDDALVAAVDAAAAPCWRPSGRVRSFRVACVLLLVELSAIASGRLLLELAVAADQRVGRAVVRELRARPGSRAPGRSAAPAPCPARRPTGRTSRCPRSRPA